MGCANATGVVADAHEVVVTTKTEPSFHDSYLLSDKLGKGAFGTVYAAKRTDSGEEVAVKVTDLRQDKSAGSFKAGDKDRRQERQVGLEVSMLEHVCGVPRSVRFLASFTEGSLHYLVMEKCDRDLVSTLKALPVLNELTMRPYIRQMFEAVDAVHSVGVVHRDIKPENFMCVGSTVKLCDFGLSATFSANLRPRLEGCSGTAPYMAPEMIRGELYKNEVDVWALGVTVYVLFYGQFPYVPARLSSELMKEAILEGAPIKFSAAEGVHEGTCVSPSGKAFVRRLLARSVAVRPSCQEALTDDFFTTAECGTGCLRATIAAAEKLGSMGARQAEKLAVKTDVDAHLDVLQRKQRALHFASLKASSMASPTASVSTEFPSRESSSTDNDSRA